MTRVSARDWVCRWVLDSSTDPHRPRVGVRKTRIIPFKTFLLAPRHGQLELYVQFATTPDPPDWIAQSLPPAHTRSLSCRFALILPELFQGIVPIGHNTLGSRVGRASRNELAGSGSRR